MTMSDTQREVEDDEESHHNDSVIAETKAKSEIPVELIEKPAPETLPTLDKTLDAVRLNGHS